MGNWETIGTVGTKENFEPNANGILNMNTVNKIAKLSIKLKENKQVFCGDRCYGAWWCCNSRLAGIFLIRGYLFKASLP